MLFESSRTRVQGHRYVWEGWLCKAGGLLFIIRGGMRGCWAPPHFAGGFASEMNIKHVSVCLLVLSCSFSLFAGLRILYKWMLHMHLTFDVWRLTFDVWRLTFDVWRLTSKRFDVVPHFPARGDHSRGNAKACDPSRIHRFFFWAGGCAPRTPPRAPSARRQLK